MLTATVRHLVTNPFHPPWGIRTGLYKQNVTVQDTKALRDFKLAVAGGILAALGGKRYIITRGEGGEVCLLS